MRIITKGFKEKLDYAERESFRGSIKMLVDVYTNQGMKPDEVFCKLAKKALEEFLEPNYFFLPDEERKRIKIDVQERLNFAIRAVYKHAPEAAYALFHIIDEEKAKRNLE